MNLKLRPIEEAPAGRPLLAIWRSPSGAGEVREVEYALVSKYCGANHAVGFYLIDELIEAAKILDAITPAGYEYDSHEDSTKWPSGLHCQRVVNFRRVVPPVEYEYVTDGKIRKPEANDWVLDDEGDGVMVWKEVRRCVTGLLPPQLCYRRIEVKK